MQTSTPDPDVASNASPHSREDLVWTFVIAIEVFLAAWVVRAYELETRTLFDLLLVVAVGFPISAMLPLRHRLRFFLGLSLVGMVVAFGPAGALWLFAVGMVLIGICHLPVSFRARIVALVVVGALLATARVGALPGPWQHAVWPILGSMFMFRIALYLHSLKHDDLEPSFARSAAYFFMLPNVAFPLYPVVDHTTWAKTYFDRRAVTIYETGIQWIVRGLVQLVLYRVAYQYVLIPADEVLNLGDLTRFMLGTYLLYLRVSGSFHLIIGILYLFGFRLPETHHLYYLSSGMTDFWRRINIYWKDFMLKLVYYPSFFRLRRRGTRLALAISTVLVFFATWILHSYQWFWLRGGFPITAPDMLFWGILGFFVVRAALKEAERGRERSLGRNAWSGKLAIRTVMTFCGICFLWSLWSAESVVEWLWMLGAARRVELVDLLWMGGLFAAGLAIAGWSWGSTGLAETEARSWVARPATQGAMGLAALLLVAQPAVRDTLPEGVATTLASIQENRLNRGDLALQHKGYYEKLDQRGEVGAQLWQVLAERPEDWRELQEIGGTRPTDDPRLQELTPSFDGLWNGHRFSTNDLGMRDRPYTVDKPEGTFRIALLGASQVMGAMISDDDTFESVLEERLNASGALGVERVEILNFAVAGYGALQQIHVLEERALRFDPDVAILTVAPVEPDRVENYLLNLAAADLPDLHPDVAEILEARGYGALRETGVPVPFQGPRALLAELGIETRMPWSEARLRLRGAGEESVAYAVDRFADIARDRGVAPILISLDIVNDPPASSHAAIEAARAADMHVIDLVDVYEEGEAAELRVAPWDNHPNARGHELIADRLYAEFTARPEVLAAPTSDDGAPPPGR